MEDQSRPVRSRKLASGCTRMPSACRCASAGISGAKPWSIISWRDAATRSKVSLGMKFEGSKRAAAEPGLLDARPMEAELADGAAVRNAPEEMVKKIAKAPPPGFVDVDGAAARANVFVPHA